MKVMGNYRKAQMPILTLENMNTALDLSMSVVAELKERGEKILANLNPENEPEEAALQLVEFIKECKNGYYAIYSSRKLFTERLLAWQKKFVFQEDEINPLKQGSIANSCLMCLESFDPDLLTSMPQLAGEIKIRREPYPVDPQGFFELFEFWWEEKGQYLPYEDLERFFKLPLLYARQRAQKGFFIENSSVGYRLVPTLRLN